MSSAELSHWWALFAVHAEEAEHQRDLAESGDGEVHVYGRDTEDEDEDGDSGDDSRDA